MAQVFADAGYRMSKGIEDGVLAVRVPDPAHRHLGRGDGAPRAPGREGVDAAAAELRTGSSCYGKGDRVQGLVNSMLRRRLPGRDRRGEHRRRSRSAGCRPPPTLADVDGRLDLALVSVPTAELGRGGDRRRAQGRPRHGRADRHRRPAPGTTGR